MLVSRDFLNVPINLPIKSKCCFLLELVVATKLQVIVSQAVAVLIFGLVVLPYSDFRECYRFGMRASERAADSVTPGSNGMDAIQPPSRRQWREPRYGGKSSAKSITNPTVINGTVRAPTVSSD